MSWLRRTSAAARAIWDPSRPLLARIRVLFLSVSLVMLGATVPAVLAGSGGRAERAAALLSLAGVAGCGLRCARTGRFPLPWELVGPAAVLLAGAVVDSVHQVAGIAYTGVLFASLHGSRRTLAARLLLYAGALAAASPQRPGGALTGAELMQHLFGLGVLGASALLVVTVLTRYERDQATLLEALVRNSSDVVTVVGADTVVRFQSPSVRRVLGYAPGSLDGTALADLLHPDDVAPALAALARVVERTDGGATIACRLRHREGRWCDTETTAANLLDEPSVHGVVLHTRDVSDRTALEAQLRHRALHDELTGLANRLLFGERLEQARARAERHGEAWAVLLVDVDGFKAVNDTWGHAGGDELLRAVAARQAAGRPPPPHAPPRGRGHWGRGGEGLRGAGPARAAAERLLDALQAPVDLAGTLVPVRVSIGVVVGGGDGGTSSAEQLLHRADVALYAAKAAGKGRCALYEPRMDDEAAQRLQLEADLRQAVDEGRFALRYQPIVDLADGAIAGAEALLRWAHPGRGMVAPSEFVPVAERTGLIVPIGAWVLREACAQAGRWQRLSARPLGVSVNVSAVQLRHPDLVRHVEEALAAAGLAPSSLVLELTESVAVREAGPAAAALERLRARGVRIAIDDFGTGYSSLAYLRRLPVDVVKVDKSFVDDVAGEPEAAALARAIVELGRTLRLETVAEGIEHAEQAELLREMGCAKGQGYHFARPATVDEVDAMLLAGPLGQVPRAPVATGRR